MKTNFISNLKQFLFLAFALIGTFGGYSQSTQNPSIGGGKTIRTDSADDLLQNIGGSKGTPRDNDGGMIVLSSYTKTNCIFASPIEIGGGGRGTGTTDTGQLNDDDFDPYDIGGGRNSTGGLGLVDIGGHGTKGTSTTMLGADDDDFFPSDIGGRGGRGTGTSTGGEFAYLIDTGGRGLSGTGTGQYDDDDTDPYDIGGKSTTGGLGNYAFASPIGGSKTPDLGNGCDIGGRGSVGTGTGEFALLTLEYIPGQGCIFDTGGRDTGTDGLNHNPIGGKNTDTGLITIADTGGRNGSGTSTSGDNNDDGDDDYDTGGRGGKSTTGEIAVVVTLPLFTIQ